MGCVVIFLGRLLGSGENRADARFSNKDLHSCFRSRRYLISSGRPCSHGTSALVGCIVTADDLLCCHLSMWVVLSSFLVGRFVPGKIALRAIFQ